MDRPHEVVRSFDLPGSPNEEIELSKLKRPEDAFVADIIAEYEHVPGMIKENTVWDVYNNEARKVDNELVKDWQSSLNFLLVFAAIFAAVLTAFIIESKKLLEEDQTKLLVTVTLWNMNNMGNFSNLPYTPPDFKTSYAAVSINCFLFASLAASLIAALSSVIALQWVADYDAAITRGGSSSEDRAKRRQFRFAGVVDWKMSEIIAALPNLLYSSVILFWVGLIQWIWSIHPVVGYVVAGGTAISVSFYASTTFLVALYVSAPFRTPLSRGLYWTLQAPITSIGKLDLSLRAPQWVNRMRPRRRAPDPDTLYALLYWTIVVISRYLRRLSSSICSIKSPVFVSRSIQWLKTYLLPNMTSRLREDKAAQDDTALEQQALIWLAYQLPISADSHRRLNLLLAEVANNPRATIVTPGNTQDPWPTILNYFSTICLKRVLATKTDEGKFDDVGVLLRFIERLKTEGRIKASDQYQTDPERPSYWWQCCPRRESSSQISESMSFLLARDVPIPSINSMDELMTTTKLIRWRNLNIKQDAHVWMEIFACPENYSQDYLDSCRQIFSNFLSSLTYPGGGLKLPFSGKPEKRRKQIIELVEVSMLAMDKVRSVDPETMHRYLMWYICDGMKALSEEWPCPSPCPDEISQRVARVEDPCLALLARFACGVTISANPKMTKLYKSKYIESIERIQDFFYCSVSRDDSAAIWDFRAAVFGIEGITLSASEPCRQALRDRKSLRALQQIMQHSTHCHGHLQGDCHMLFHLYISLPTWGKLRPEVVTSGGLRVVTSKSNLILLFLAAPSLEYLFYSLEQIDIDPLCLEIIWNACQAVKRQTGSLYALLMEILVSKFDYNPYNVALILDPVLQVLSMRNNVDPSVLLLPLAHALTGLPRKMRWLHTEDRYLEAVATQSEEVSRLLYTASASVLISSASHIKILSCAKANISPQPATGWLPMFIDI